jgi:hypothetical protein
MGERNLRPYRGVFMDRAPAFRRKGRALIAA